MSILIKGIDVPKNGDRHHITIYDNGNAYITTSNMLYETDRKDVEVVEIPTPHGRLIDENMIQGALIAEAYKNGGKFQFGDTIKWTPSEVGEIISNNVPTILEAEEF